MKFALEFAVLESSISLTNSTFLLIILISTATTNEKKWWFVLVVSELAAFCVHTLGSKKKRIAELSR